jgi:hypothetical protein
MGGGTGAGRGRVWRRPTVNADGCRERGTSFSRRAGPGGYQRDARE